MGGVWPVEAEVGGRRVAGRPLGEEGLDALLAYWHESPIEYLKSLSVDPRKQGPPAETRKRPGASLEADSGALCVVTKMEGELVAYSNVGPRGASATSTRPDEADNTSPALQLPGWSAFEVTSATPKNGR
jgi:hypothetical protein